MTHLVVGIDIGGTNTVIGLVDRQGTIHRTTSFKTAQFYDGPTFVKAMAEAIRNLCGSEFEIEGIGIGCPNANHFKGIMEKAPNLNISGEVPFVSLFQEAFRPDLPVMVTNDANAAAVGEMIFGGAQNMRDFIEITIGTGVGSGFIANGQLIYGYDSFAGEFGHTIIEPNGRLCNCGRKGCLERYASAGGMVETYHELCDDPHNPIHNAYDLLQAAKAGDPLAMKAIDRTAQILGLALSNLVLITSPEAIFLFGGPVKAGSILTEPIHHYMEQYMMSFFKGRVKLITSELIDKNAAILGAAAMIFQHQKTH